MCKNIIGILFIILLICKENTEQVKAKNFHPAYYQAAIFLPTHYERYEYQDLNASTRKYRYAQINQLVIILSPTNSCVCLCFLHLAQQPKDIL